MGFPILKAPSDAVSRLQADHLPAKVPWAESPLNILKRSWKSWVTFFTVTQLSKLYKLHQHELDEKWMKSREILL